MNPGTTFQEFLRLQRAYDPDSRMRIVTAREMIDERFGLGQAQAREILRTNVEASAIHEVGVRTVAELLPFHYGKFTDQYAQIADMADWADHLMQSPPHFIIGGDYMHRWHVIPRNAMQNVYLHHLLRSDEDVMHDHPFDSTSLIIRGGFTEHTPDGSFERKPGDIVTRKGADPHWLELPKGRTSVSLFFTGPKIRDWGFWCGARWVPWQVYTGGYHDGRSDTGAGCGEPA